MTKAIKSATAEAEQQLKQFKTDPLKFVSAVMGAAATPQQIEGFRAIRQYGAHVSIRSGHGTGKSTFLSWVALWFLVCFDDCKIPCTAPSAHQLQDILWSELSFWHSQMSQPYRSMIEITYERAWIAGLKETNFMVPRTARPDKPEALQGFHGKNLLFEIDEASGVADKVFEVAEGSLSTPGARVLLAGNPTRTAGYFYDSHHSQRAHFKTLHWSSVDSPLVARTYIDQMATKYGVESDIYRVRVLGDFPRSEPDQFIPLDLLEDAAVREVQAFGPVVWGLDPAWLGGDETALAKRKGYVISEIKGVFGLEPMQVVGWLDAEYQSCKQEERPEIINIDSIGMGAGIYSRAKEIGLPVRAVNVAEATSSKKKYHRLRDELWGLYKDWLLERCCKIPDDSDLIGQSSTIKFNPFHSGGVTKIESKKELRDRGKPSPDRADAVCLTFYHAPITTGTFAGPAARQSTAITDYDLFGG